MKKQLDQKRKVVIIGAGVSGLTAGIHALIKGHDVVILEKNNYIGGKLNLNYRDYFNYYPKFIRGLKEFNYLLNEIGITNKAKVVDQLPIFKTKDGQLYAMKNDLKEFSYFLKYNSMGDDILINELIKNIKKCGNYVRTYIAPYELSSFKEKGKQKASEILNYRLSKIFGNMSVSEYLNKFNSDVIRDSLGSIMDPSLSAITLMILLSIFFSGNLGEVDFDLITELKEKFTTLGGKILLNKECKEFEFSRINKVKSVKLKDGSSESGDYFISSTDPYFTFETLLKKKYNDRKFYLRYEDKANYTVDSKLIVAFKVNKEFKFDSIVITCNDLKIGVKYFKYIKFFKSKQNQNYIYASLVLDNKDYDYLKAVADQEGLLRGFYKETISKIKNIFMDNFKEYNLDVVDALSPISMEKDNYAYLGSMSGFRNQKGQYDIISDGLIPNLDNVLLCSSWLNSTGGILNAMITGKFSICRLEKVIKNEK